MFTMLKNVLLALAAVIAVGSHALAELDPAKWSAVAEEARGQTVYWNAWAGESRINDYIAWAGREVEARYGFKVVHVKIGDTAEAVARVVGEKAAGNTAAGAVDMIWINGENFSSMKRNGLLFGPWAEALPNFALTDPDNNRGVREDFTVPVEGFEAPWGKAQIVLYYDAARLNAPPKSMTALLAWAKANPGRFAYPLPPDFLGSTFLKQALMELSPDREALYRPAEDAIYGRATAPLWAFLDQLHPNLWRGGMAFPGNSSGLRRLVADNEIDIGFSFHPAEASAAIANGELPDTVRTYILDGGTIGNVSFLAIPFNGTHKAGALILANFLLSPEAQAHKEDPATWGSSTVLAMNKLSSEQKALFDRLDLGKAALRPEELGAILPEPHPSWMERLEKDWAGRYSGR